jgi:hypothetical protein
MKAQFIPLPEKFTRQLLAVPETGMGYQLVKVILTGGRILDHLRVFNASLLEWKNKEPLQTEDIIKLELESR